jgi:hypothetical protein
VGGYCVTIELSEKDIVQLLIALVNFIGKFNSTESIALSIASINQKYNLNLISSHLNPILMIVIFINVRQKKTLHLHNAMI